MSEQQTPEIPVVEIPTVVVEEKVYRYQPVDENNRPIGGEQVVKYTTQDELIGRLQEQNVLLIRKLREQTKKVRLGIVEKEEVPEGAQRFAGPVEFTPRDLTDEQRYDIARRLADPVTAAQAAQELVEASLGAPLPELGKTLQTIQQDNINLRAKLEVGAFLAENPTYYKCPENFETISNWMVKNELSPVKENFQLAYDTLRAQGLLVNGPAIVIEHSAVPVQVVEEIPVIPAQPVQKTEDVVVVQRSIPNVALTRENTSVAVPVQPATSGNEITYVLNGQTLTGLKAIAAMPGEEYGRRMRTDRNFAKLVDKLEAEARKPKAV
jgi:hypothetical protein